MIKLVDMAVTRPATLSLAFSDDSAGNWSAEELIARDTIMTRPLADPDFFARAFIEAGALAWPNGLELSATSLHRRLAAAGALIRPAA
jgi:hypothetical protein